MGRGASSQKQEEGGWDRRLLEGKRGKGITFEMNAGSQLTFPVVLSPSVSGPPTIRVGLPTSLTQ